MPSRCVHGVSATCSGFFSACAGALSAHTHTTHTAGSIHEARSTGGEWWRGAGLHADPSNPTYSRQLAGALVCFLNHHYIRAQRYRRPLPVIHFWGGTTTILAADTTAGARAQHGGCKPSQRRPITHRVHCAVVPSGHARTPCKQAPSSLPHATADKPPAGNVNV